MSGLPLSSALYFALTHLYIELHPSEHKGRSTPLKAVLTLCGSVELLEMTRETALLPQTTHVKKETNFHCFKVTIMCRPSTALWFRFATLRVINASSLSLSSSS